MHRQIIRTGLTHGGRHDLDDPERKRDLRDLVDAAYAVDWVTDGQTAIEAAQAESYDVALLDLGLPETDGQEVLRRLRQTGRQLPVIIVTARDGIDDRIDGLDLGADDYLVKPFEIRELLARMRAVLRRQGSGSSAILSNGKISLDPATREATFAGETSLDLRS
jgi:two-component system OmpR family response regulator